MEDKPYRFTFLRNLDSSNYNDYVILLNAATTLMDALGSQIRILEDALLLYKKKECDNLIDRVK